MKNFSLIVCFCLILIAGTFSLASAQSKCAPGTKCVTGKEEDPTLAFRKYKDTTITSLVVPTVVEVPFGNEFLERYDFAVFDQTTSSFEPYFFRREVLSTEEALTARSFPETRNTEYLLDGKTNTYTEYPLPETGGGEVKIILTSTSPIVSSGLTLLLDNFVALPSTVEIRVGEGSEEKIVVAEKNVEKTTIPFPKTTASQWTIKFRYSQPLRIEELRLIQDDTKKISTQALRFLAQPGHAYRVYFDPDRFVAKYSVGEAGNLQSNTDVKILTDTVSKNNSTYAIADQDKDGIPDIRDNCVSVTNADQSDMDGNKRGDVCDDYDKDGVINSKDNCPSNPNYNQQDTDKDGKGDVCDTEESRITENNPWLPWVAMGLGTLVVAGLFVATVRGKKVA